MVGSKPSESLRNANDNGLPRSFLRLIQNYMNKTTTSLNCRALVAYAVHILWLSFTAKKRRYLINHGNTLVGFFRSKVPRCNQNT